MNSLLSKKYNFLTVIFARITTLKLIGTTNLSWKRLKLVSYLKLGFLLAINIYATD